jgi:hypothetical protein
MVLHSDKHRWSTDAAALLHKNSLALQIPHTSIRPALSAEDRSAPAQQPAAAARATSPSPGEVTPRRSSFSHPSGGSPAAGNGGRRSSVHSQQPANSSSLLSQQHSLPQQLQEQQQPQQENLTCWSSADRLNVSIGLMYALCNLAKELGAAAGFCVPRPQLLRRWLQVGARFQSGDVLACSGCMRVCNSTMCEQLKDGIRHTATNVRRCICSVDVCCTPSPIRYVC